MQDPKLMSPKDIRPQRPRRARASNSCALLPPFDAPIAGLCAPKLNPTPMHCRIFLQRHDDLGTGVGAEDDADAAVEAAAAAFGAGGGGLCGGVVREGGGEGFGCCGGCSGE